MNSTIHRRKSVTQKIVRNRHEGSNYVCSKDVKGIVSTWIWVQNLHLREGSEILKKSQSYRVTRTGRRNQCRKNRIGSNSATNSGRSLRHDRDTTVLRVKVKVKQSHCRPWPALSVSGSWGSQILRQSAHENGKVVSPTHWPPLPPGNIPGTVKACNGIALPFYSTAESHGRLCTQHTRSVRI
jgi:hypothetical protein